MLRDFPYRKKKIEMFFLIQTEDITLQQPTLKAK